MTSYSIVEYKPCAGTFVDSSDEDVAIAEAQSAYAEDDFFAYVVFKQVGDYESEPTHIILDDVTYALIESDEMMRRSTEPERLPAVLKRALTAETHQATLRALVKEAKEELEREWPLPDRRPARLKNWLQRASDALFSIPDLKTE